MLLTIDVGNTNSVLGVFRGEELVANWRLTTAREQTVDEYGVLTRNLFTLAGLDRDAITGVIISSVVPPVNRTLAEMSRVYFGKKALFVEMGVKTGMAVLVDNPSEVGADRIVNGVAAFHQYGGPCIVVDFGTAITFDVISAKGEYLGGVIAPGHYFLVAEGGGSWVLTGDITGASGAGVSPIVITSPNHRLTTGTRVIITGVGGNHLFRNVFYPEILLLRAYIVNFTSNRIYIRLQNFKICFCRIFKMEKRTPLLTAEYINLLFKICSHSHCINYQVKTHSW